MAKSSPLRRRVPIVLDSKQGAYLTAAAVLAMDTMDAQAIRVDARRGIRSKQYRFRCAACGVPVELCAGTSNIRYYFAHHEAEPSCPWYRGESLDEEELRQRQYHGIAESEKHRLLKERIAALLVNAYGLEAVRVEKRVDAEAPPGGWMTWRKPDVYVDATIAQRRIRLAIEVQLSSAFVGVVVDRQDFYAHHGINLLWIFGEDPGSLDALTATCRDIVFLNNANAFVLDSTVDAAAEQQGRLRLGCRGWAFDSATSTLAETTAEVGLDDLVFDDQRMLVYRFDGAAARDAHKQAMAAEWQERETARIEAADKAATLARRNRIHAALDELRGAHSTAQTVEAVAEAREKRFALLAAIQADLWVGVPLTGDRCAVLKTVGSLATGQVKRPLVGWDWDNIVEALYYHFPIRMNKGNADLILHRFLIRCAMLTWFTEGVAAYERSRAGSRKKASVTLRDRVKACRDEPEHPPLPPEEAEFYAALRPLYPELFACYDLERMRHAR